MAPRAEPDGRSSTVRPESPSGKLYALDVYESDPAPQCWAFLETDGGAFHARAVGSDPADDLVTRETVDEALDCPLPDLGV